MEKEMTWHNDGHSLEFIIDKSNLVISAVNCPAEAGKCRNRHGACVFKLFIDIYGLECNVGVVSAEPLLEFAWAFIGDFDNPLEASQLWIIPTKDEIFSAWAEAQN
jgi:hypothetical protein